MGRPRKQPARILTANIPLTTWDKLDELKLTNRSVWLNRVLLDEIEREQTGIDLYEKRIAAQREEINVMLNPASKIDQISTKRLASTLLWRTEDRVNTKKQLRSNLIKLIRDEQAKEKEMD